MYWIYTLFIFLSVHALMGSFLDASVIFRQTKTQHTTIGRRWALLNDTHIHIHTYINMKTIAALTHIPIYLPFAPLKVICEWHNLPRTRSHVNCAAARTAIRKERTAQVRGCAGDRQSITFYSQSNNAECRSITLFTSFSESLNEIKAQSTDNAEHVARRLRWIRLKVCVAVALLAVSQQ